MANGQPLDESKMTCAMWITSPSGKLLRPSGNLVRIINVQTGKTLLVAWTDNGPGPVPRSRGVVIDLTPAAMIALAGNKGITAGKVRVRVERVK